MREIARLPGGLSPNFVGGEVYRRSGGRGGVRGAHGVSSPRDGRGEGDYRAPRGRVARLAAIFAARRRAAIMLSAFAFPLPAMS